MLKRVDTDKDGQVNFKEFVSMMVSDQKNWVFAHRIDVHLKISSNKIAISYYANKKYARHFKEW
jgi:hypothetical protein